MANSVDPDQCGSRSSLFASLSYSSAMLGNSLQQTTFSDAFFLGAFRVKMSQYLIFVMVRAQVSAIRGVNATLS